MGDGDDDTSDLPHVNLVFIGPCGGGKSTIAGRLIADSGAIDRRNLERIAREAADCGQEKRCYAWILDKLRCERERGGTMYIGMWKLASRRCRFTVIDAPGHHEFTKNIVTAMSQADIAVLVVTAVQEDLDIGQELEGQIREHTLLAYTIGLRQLVVCVNKMDSDAVVYSEDRFDYACSIVREDLGKAGLKTHDCCFDVHFVPTSGWSGDNIMERSENMPWYCGPTLVEALDDAVASHFKPERPLRFPVREVMQVGGVGVIAVGRVVSGSLRSGMRLVFVPGYDCAEVKSISMHHEKLDEAHTGDLVNVEFNVEKHALHSGMVGADAEEGAASECASFLAQVYVLSPPRAGEIVADCVLGVACHSAQVPCIFEKLLSRTDRRTGQVLETNPQSLKAGDSAVVRVRPQAPFCLERFSEFPWLGRFTVIDQKITVALGVVQEVELPPEVREWDDMAAPLAQSFKRKPTQAANACQRGRSRTASVDDSGEECFPMSSLGDECFAAPSEPSLGPAQPMRSFRGESDPGELSAEDPLSACRPAHTTSPFAAFGAVAVARRESGTGIMKERHKLSAPPRGKVRFRTEPDEPDSPDL